MFAILKMKYKYFHKRNGKMIYMRVCVINLLILIERFLFQYLQLQQWHFLNRKAFFILNNSRTNVKSN